MRTCNIIPEMPTAQLLFNSIERDKHPAKDLRGEIAIPDLGFSDGSFIVSELAEMYYETIKDWREKKSISSKLVCDVMQKWMRFFRKEVPGVTDQILLSFKDHQIEWNCSKGQIKISGGKAELTDDQIREIVQLFGVGRFLLFKSKSYDAVTEGLKHYSYLVTYRKEETMNLLNQIEKKGFRIEDAPDMDAVLVHGGTEKLSQEELKICAASYFITDFEIDPWRRPDGTWFYELNYGPTSFEVVKKK